VVTPTLVVSTAMGATATGGVLPLQAALLRGSGVWAAAATMSIGTATAATSACLLVASGIKN
tara:strand:- start:215 stop:400 length:186 start_codon:yes stop_codon:yes gene_type:complete